jgi:hypothetical protein
MTTRPIELRDANAFVSEHHRHSRRVAGHRWSLGLYENDELVGVMICGRPVARMIDQRKTLEVLRVCLSPRAPRNANSFLYGKAARIWSEMGGDEILTYTLEKESGASLRGAGWVAVGTVAHGEWSRPSRKRESQAVYKEPKIKWSRKLARWQATTGATGAGTAKEGI